MTQNLNFTVRNELIACSSLPELTLVCSSTLPILFSSILPTAVCDPLK